MRRTRVNQLALVNWRSVFYECYELDQNVTAFEGANGAGKTTVMMAACVALLPDMTHLGFTNLARHGGTSSDKGLWGRLGKTGRPSYTVLDIELGTGKRLLAGVQLERRSQPAIDLTPFLIFDLPPQTRLQEVLLEQSGEFEGVPQLEELRDQAARHGAQLKRCTTAKEYFKALFDHGVTPLRLESDADRRKLGEMLRTSMAGGLSPALTSNLRSFLLQEESGLSDALTRMRSNIEACARTRAEADETKEIQSEVSQIYASGQEMFNAAVHATRQRAEELAKHATQARETARAAEEALEAATAHLEETSRERGRARAQVSELESVLGNERRGLDRLREGRKIRQRIDSDSAELSKEKARYAKTKSAHQAARTRHHTAHKEYQRRVDDHERAAAGLAELEKGVEELFRRAGEHRWAIGRLNAAQALLPDVNLSAESAPEVLDRVRAERTEVEEEHNTLEAALSHLEIKRREHGEAMHALNTLTEDNIDPDHAHTRAREALKRMRKLEAETHQIGRLAEAYEQAARWAQEQEQARAQAQALSDENRHLQSQADVTAAHHDAQHRVRTGEKQGRDAEQALRSATSEAAAAKARIRQLEDEATRWRAARSTAEGLERAWECTLGSRDEISALRARFETEAIDAREVLQDREAEKRQLETEEALLRETGGKMAPEMAALRDQVAGELLAASYEDIAIEDAATAEARLGPLAGAIVVDDPESAAVDILQAEARPDSVWLITRGKAPSPENEQRAKAHVFEDDVIVESDDGAWRITRKPANPILGRLARERRLEELKQETRSTAAQITRAREKLEAVQDARAGTDTLLADADLIEAGDPGPKMDAEQRRAEQCEADATLHRKARADLDASIASETSRLDALNALLRTAWLLDEHSYREQHKALEDRLKAARANEKELKAKAEDRAVLEEKIDVLRTVPPSQEKEQELRERLESRTRRAHNLTAAQRALEEALSNPAALGWTDAPAALDAKRALVPTLKAQLEQAKFAAERAKTTLDAASEDLNKAVLALNEDDARVKARIAALERAQDDWSRLAIEDASDATIAAAETRVAAREKERDEADERHETLIGSVGKREAEKEQAERTRTQRQHEAEQQEAAAKPAQERWERLRADAEGHGVLAPALAPKVVNTLERRGYVTLFGDARVHAMSLKDRLAKGTPQGETMAAIEALLESLNRGGSYEALRTWLEVRSWLHRRIPAHISQDDDPLEALGRLGRYVERLSTQLTTQEDNLKGTSKDVANSIGILISRAHREVSRLNSGLREIRFGSIAGVRLKLDRITHMQDTLDALRKGEDQQALFQPETPIEEALDALFSRHGGKRGQGHKLLDYREYVEPQVEVMRQTEHRWEKANAIRISTGESIGIGAALMMVVLTAWERNANLLRSSRSHGTLRLLFLDEANRLDRDNLGVLFNLCQNLDLQLLIAAPEVAQAEGNTTYRLVRKPDAEGGEEVIVTGRRPEAAEAA